MNNTISPVEEYAKGAYWVVCEWDGSAKIEKQFYEARDYCKAFNVVLSHQPHQEHATLSGVSVSSERNRKELARVRSYLIHHFGWAEDQEVLNID